MLEKSYQKVLLRTFVKLHIFLIKKLKICICTHILDPDNLI